MLCHVFKHGIEQEIVEADFLVLLCCYIICVVCLPPCVARPARRGEQEHDDKEHYENIFDFSHFICLSILLTWISISTCASAMSLLLNDEAATNEEDAVSCTFIVTKI